METFAGKFIVEIIGHFEAKATLKTFQLEQNHPIYKVSGNRL